MQQPHAHPGLELGQVARHHGARHAQVHRRRRQAAAIGNFHEDLHGFQTIHDCLALCIRLFCLYRILMRFKHLKFASLNHPRPHAP
ncbi:Uncharacterised protein [Bordetella pertussis]|nr:Uncharacterised protein [Bordetella pertussis]CFW47317.1 Uncharacterised protein [Bordetella pertussis]